MLTFFGKHAPQVGAPVWHGSLHLTSPALGSHPLAGLQLFGVFGRTIGVGSGLKVLTKNIDSWDKPPQKTVHHVTKDNTTKIPSAFVCVLQFPG